MIAVVHSRKVGRCGLRQALKSKKKSSFVGAERHASKKLLKANVSILPVCCARRCFHIHVFGVLEGLFWLERNTFFGHSPPSYARLRFSSRHGLATLIPVPFHKNSLISIPRGSNINTERERHPQTKKTGPVTANAPKSSFVTLYYQHKPFPTCLFHRHKSLDASLSHLHQKPTSCTAQDIQTRTTQRSRTEETWSSTSEPRVAPHPTPTSRGYECACKTEERTPKGMAAPNVNRYTANHSLC